MDTRMWEIEEAAALGWQPLDADRLGGWLLRAAEGFTGRANSALPLGEPDRSLPEAVEAVRRWYAARSLPACIVVPHKLSGPQDDPLDRLLVELGWGVRPGPAIVMAAPTATVLEALADRTAGRGGPAAQLDVRLADDPDEEWLGIYRYRGRPLPAVATRLLRSAPWQAFASLRRDGATVAVGRVAVAAGWAGLTAVEVMPSHRRHGLGAAVTAVLAGAAAEQGADHLYLQVEEANTAARALYTRCGFTDSHRYHYRLEPNPTRADSVRTGLSPRG